MMNFTQVVPMSSFTITIALPIQDYTHPDVKIQPTYVITLGYQTISGVNTNFFVSIFYIARLSCHLFQPSPHVFSSALKCLPRLSTSFQLWS